MLTLNKLQAKFSRPILNVKNKKHLRISVGNAIAHTNYQGKIINQKSIEWNENLVLPLMFNKEFSFEIHQKHEFGYNTQEFKGILKGSFQIISPNQTWNTWQIFSKDKQKIGFLSAEITIPNQLKNSPAALRKSRLGNQSSIFNSNSVQNQQSQVQIQNNKSLIRKYQNQSKINDQLQKKKDGKVVRITSIVAKITGSRFKKGYVIVKIGNRQIKTKTTRSRSGQLVFIQSEQIDYFQNDTDAEIQVYSVDSRNEQNLIACGTLQLLNPRPPRSIGLVKDGYDAGQMLIDSKIQDRNKGKTNFSKIFQQNNSLFEQSVVNKSKKYKNDATHSVDYTKLQDFGISQTSRVNYYGLDSSRSTLSPNKRRSVLNGNNNIAFPKQKRFMLYQDKQNQRISYLKDRSFDFKNDKSGKYYKGAGFGYGGKTDFANQRKSIPGVGNYHLPSIWDRY